MHKRILSDIHIRLVVTDKYAGFNLPDRENMTDYRAIMSDAPQFYKWCKDLFLYYWEKSKPHIPYYARAQKILWYDLKLNENLTISRKGRNKKL